jgi:hypothetical protein
MTESEPGHTAEPRNVLRCDPTGGAVTWRGHRRWTHGCTGGLMEAVAWTDDVVNAMDRDPRSYPFGYFTGGASPLDTARALLDDFFVAKRQAWTLEPGEEGRFIEYLKSCQS